MDFFGIGAAMQGMAEVYFRSARRTGRTTSLVQSVKDGDRIIFADSLQAEHVRRLCIERGVVVECIVLDPRTPDRIFKRGSSEGRTIFDHSWVEQKYRMEIERVQQEIDYIEREASGQGPAHNETKRRAVEMAKWRV